MEPGIEAGYLNSKEAGPTAMMDHHSGKIKCLVYLTSVIFSKWCLSVAIVDSDIYSLYFWYSRTGNIVYVIGGGGDIYRSQCGPHSKLKPEVEGNTK